MIIWTELVEHEPKLAALEQQVRAEAARAVGDPLWSFSRYWSFDLRPALRSLVGWERPAFCPPELTTEEAWHAAVSHLVGLLPDENAIGRWAS